MTTLFFSYSHADEQLRDLLEKHLSMLRHQGLINTWHDRRILAGDEFDHAISQNLERADLILLLVSSDFLASGYCYDVEMMRALERHAEGSARVVPVIVRACDWHSAPFGTLLGLPTDGKPIMSWADIDQAFLDVVQGVRRIIEQQKEAEAPMAQLGIPQVQSVQDPVYQPARSSNLRIKKAFTEADKDSFAEEGFGFMKAFFEESLKELEKRNSNISSKFRYLDANRFVAKVYQNGNLATQCKVTLNGMFGRGISFSHDVSEATNTINESLGVLNDDQSLFFRPMGMAITVTSQSDKLTFQGASEYFWALLIQRIQ